MTSQLDAVLNNYTKSLPCTFGAVATRDNGMVYLNSAGVKDSTLDNKVTNDTTVAFFSCTKAVTATALLQLLENGTIQSIDDPVEKYLPETKDVKILTGFDNDNNPILETAKNKPTIRHLLTHTSGLSYSFFSHLYEKYSSNGHGANILNSTWDDFNTPLIFEPGTKWHYGASIDWIGKIIYEVTGQSLGDYCKANIFDRIGATSLTFQKSTQQFNDSTEIHSRAENDTFSPMHNILQKEPKFHPGGHGLYGTIGDFMKFLQIFLHHGLCTTTNEQILKPETVANYSFNDLLPEGVEIENSLQVSQPTLSTYVNCFDNHEKQSWTANFHKIDVPLKTGRPAQSYSWCGLPNLYYWIDIHNGIVGMFATQLFPFRDDKAVNGFEEFESTVYKILPLLK